MNKDTIIDKESKQQQGDTTRWVVGLLILFTGLFMSASVLFYYADWSADYSIIYRVDSENPNFKFEQIANPCGHIGAWIGELLVGRSFGVVGILFAVMLSLLGLRIVRQEPLKLGRVSLMVALLMLFGSLSLAFVFGGIEVFNSGLGGAFGVESITFLKGVIGSVGCIIMLLGGWILTGVFINRNFINTVNSAGSVALDRGERIVDIVKNSVSNPKHSNDASQIQREEVEENIEDLGASSVAQSEEEYELGESPFRDIIEQIEQEQSVPQEDEQPEIQGFIEDDVNIPFEVEHAVQNPIVEPQQDGPDSGVVVTVEANEVVELEEEDIESSLYDPLRELNDYQLPPVNLLEDYINDERVGDEEIYDNKTNIEETLKHFGIPIQRIKATVGPTITLYEIVQAQGVKISKIQGLENDIAQSLKALGIRIIAPIPGRGTIGIEVPNRHKQVVSMYSSVRSQRFQELRAELPIVIGRNIQNETYVFDLAKMPHLLVAGATGQGKSVGLNAIITSLLYRKHPAELKLVMIDPKMVEFTPYKSLEHHFMAKMESEEDVIITDPKKAVYTLNALCDEMEKRLKLLSIAAVRNIVEYNSKFRQRRLNPEKGHFFMPYIVVIVDEFADLIMMSREVEAPVMRLAQKARAVGIHLIVATQRPDVKVITGGIKANFPARIAFRVMQMIDSRTIIDQPGANQLIGRGDMLFSKDGELTRIQCALVETEEVVRVVDYIAAQKGYTEAYRLPDYTPEGAGDADLGSESGAPVKYDSLFCEIARAAVSNGSISTSSIQRNYEVGFNRAGRIMTQLERAGIVGRQEGAKPREILFFDMPSLEAKLQSLGLF